MHLNFAFNTVQTLWTVRFAALLVLLVVLLGRDRVNRFPWFSASIALAALIQLVSRLLYGRLPQLTFAGVSIVLLDVSALVGILVLMEVARTVFRGAGARAWAAGAGVLLAAGAAVLIKLGAWPAMATLKPTTPIALLGLLQLVAEKINLLNGVLAIGLGLLVVALGRKFGTGLRSHALHIVAGLSVVALAQFTIQLVWRYIAMHNTPQTLDEYHHILDLKDKLINANDAIYAVVIVGWILALWFDEPAAKAATTPEAPSAEQPAQIES
jgi:hypothetical protein